MFYAVARTDDRQAICAIRFDRENNKMMLVGASSWLDILEQVFKTRPTIGWMLGQNSDNPLQAGAGQIPQMIYYQEGQGEDRFHKAMSEMSGEEVRVIEPMRLNSGGESNGE